MTKRKILIISSPFVDSSIVAFVVWITSHSLIYTLSWSIFVLWLTCLAVLINKENNND